MNYKQQKNYVSTGIATGALALLAGCTTIQPAAQAPTIDAQVQEKKASYEKTVADENSLYASFGSDNIAKLSHIKSQLEAVMKDGVIQPATEAYEINEVKVVKQQRDRAKEVAKSLKGDDTVTKALLEQANGYATKAQEYLTAFAQSGQLKTKLVLFMDRKDAQDSWYFHEPEAHAEIKANPITIAPYLGLTVEESIDLAIDRMQSGLGEKFGLVTSSDWTEARHNEFKRDVFNNSGFVQEAKVSSLVELFPGYENKDGKVTQGTLRATGSRVMTGDSYLAKLNEGKMLAYVFYVPTKAEVKPTPTDAERIKALEDKVKELTTPKESGETPKEPPKETPGATPGETPKEPPKETPGATPGETPKENPPSNPFKD